MEFLENGLAVFGKDTTLLAYEKRVKEMERLLGRQEVEIALLQSLEGPQEPPKPGAGIGGSPIPPEAKYSARKRGVLAQRHRKYLSPLQWCYGFSNPSNPKIMQSG